MPPPESLTETAPSLAFICEPGQIQIEAAAAEDGKAVTLPRFTMVAYTGGAMRVGSWRYPVTVDLAGLAIPSQHRPIRFGHDAANGVGHTDRIALENGRLLASGLVSRDTPAAREVVVAARNGFPWQASIGASVEEYEFVKEGQSAQANGREFKGPLFIVRKSVLGEISFVDLGADGQTSVAVAASAGKEEAQVDPKTKTQEPSAAPDPVEAMRAQAAAEVSRIGAIQKLCGTEHAELAAQAIREGWDAAKTELAILRASRPAVPNVQSPATPEVSGALLEAACLQAAKLNGLEKHFDERTLDAAYRRFKGGVGLHELLLEAAWANGYRGRVFRESKAAMQAAFGLGVEAGLSTIDIGGILSNVANKFLLDGFFSVERTWRNICAVRNVSDFKTVTSYRLIGKDQYERVVPGGELKHGTLGEEKYTNKVDTYGLMLEVDRQDIVNDDLGAITSVPRKLGRGSGLVINDVFWKAFLDNATFFTAALKNFLAGVDTALSIDGLTKAEVAFNEQVDADGNPTGVMPALVLVPPALSAFASQLFKSMELRETTANAKYPVSNPHQGKFRVEVSRYLSNAKLPGNSAKAWYLLADPADLPVIEVAFLNGKESPTIESAEADFNKLGIQMRGYHDFGVNKQDARGGVKSKGEA